MLLIVDDCKRTAGWRALFEFGTPQLCVKDAQEGDVCVVAAHLAAPEGSVRKADRDQQIYAGNRILQCQKVIVCAGYNLPLFLHQHAIHRPETVRN